MQKWLLWHAPNQLWFSLCKFYMWGAFGADRWNFIVILFNYSTTEKAFGIYLTELLCVAKQKHELFTLLLFFWWAHLLKALAQGRISPVFSCAPQLGTLRLVCGHKPSRQGLFCLLEISSITGCIHHVHQHFRMNLGTSFPPQISPRPVTMIMEIPCWWKGDWNEIDL